jgi:flagellar biosynthesis/type III secretory pathway M-ring protein FliF/YscJ
MKIFHKKFLNQEQQFVHNTEDITTQDKTKFSYLLNQTLIWGVIFVVIFFIFKFTTIYIN